MRTATVTATLLALLLAPFVVAASADAADDAAGGSAPPRQHAASQGEADGGLFRATRCMSACHARGGGRDACLQSCARRAERVVNAPATSTLEQLSACLDDCYSDKTLRSTDRETCKLTCEQVASLAGPGKKPDRR